MCEYCEFDIKADDRWEISPLYEDEGGYLVEVNPIESERQEPMLFIGGTEPSFPIIPINYYPMYGRKLREG